MGHPKYGAGGQPGMDSTIFLFLVQDGITNGALYGLLGIATVLVFAVTRIIFVPQGEFVTYGALTLALLDTGRTPGTIWLLIGFGVTAFLVEMWLSRHVMNSGRILREGAVKILLPCLIAVAAIWLAPIQLPPWANLLLTLAIIAPMGPYLYTIAFRPVAEASVLTLFIVAIGVHLSMQGLGLLFFGAEGLRSAPLSNLVLPLGPLMITGQTLAVYILTLVTMASLTVFFNKPLFGKALRATAINRLGARLVGIRTSLAGTIAFLLAAMIGALTGALIAPMTTIYYDTGFLIGLKGFIAAIIGSLASYPVTVIAAIIVGLAEAFASFFASQYKEVIVFTLIIPVLIWLSFTSHHVEEEDS